MQRPNPCFIGIVLSAAVILLTIVPVRAERFSPALKASCHLICGAIYDDRFDEAEMLIDSLTSSGAPLAFCRFFRAVLYLQEMMVNESDFLEDKFIATLDSVKADAEMMLAAGTDSALGYGFIGHSHSFRAAYYGRNGRSVFKAARHGLAARRAYARAYEIDPAFHDVALGLGSYKYWKSAKTGLINWTPLFKNEKAEGIRLIRLAIDSSAISQNAATISLIWVLIDDEYYDEAIHLATDMQREFPNGSVFRWALGRAYFESNAWSSAADIYEDILGRLSANPGNCYNVIEASYYLSRCYRRLSYQSDDVPRKLSFLREQIRSMSIPKDTRRMQKHKIEEILRN